MSHIYKSSRVHIFHCVQVQFFQYLLALIPYSSYNFQCHLNPDFTKSCHYQLLQCPGLSISPRTWSSNMQGFQHPQCLNDQVSEHPDFLMSRAVNIFDFQYNENYIFQILCPLSRFFNVSQYPGLQILGFLNIQVFYCPCLPMFRASKVQECLQYSGLPVSMAFNIHEFQHSGPPKTPISRITNVLKIQGFQYLQHPVLPMFPMSRVSNGASIKVFQQLQVFLQHQGLPANSSLPGNPHLPDNPRLPDDPVFQQSCLPQNPCLPGKSTSSRKIHVFHEFFKDFQLIHTFRKNLCLLPNPSLPINPGLPANLHLLEKSRSSIQSTSSRKIYIFQSIHVFQTKIYVFH